MEKTISITTEKLKELYKILTHYPCIAKEQVDYEMCKVFGERTLKEPVDVMERVKTFEDACRELGERHPLVKSYRAWMSARVANQKDVDAYLKLRIICAALNEGWTSELTERGDRMLPFLVIYREKDLNSLNEESKKSLVSLRLNNNLVYYEMRASPQDKYVIDSCLLLTLRNRDLAEYCGRQFKEIWVDYLIGYRQQ